MEWNVAPEVFQRSIEQIFASYPYAIIVNDIIADGRNIKEHDKNLQKMLDGTKSQDVVESTGVQIPTNGSKLCGTCLYRAWAET